MGAVTPFGVSVDRMWDGLLEGKSAVSPVTLFDTEKFDVVIGGQVPNFDAGQYIDRKLIKRMDPFVHLAMVATDEAIKDAGLEVPLVGADRCSVVIGSGIGGLNELETQFVRLAQKGPGKVSAFTIPKLMVNAASGNVSIAFGATGASIAVSSACASATNAMGEAIRYIRAGESDLVITGGSEAALTPLALSAFAAMKALSTRNDNPTIASRPFDRDRDGFVLGEGAGILIFEELEHAKARGARILAEVLGFGCTSDALHIAQPSEDGKGAAKAMQRSLEDAQITSDDVDYINAHATSTPLGDVAETKAIKRVFGEHANKLVISSTKGAIGHLLGASGGVELIATIRGIQHGVVTPTVNLENPGEGCDLDYCPQTPRDCQIKVAISNSFGFGGHNACLVVRKYE
jgi:3-oxoacyl-[acyl-carrier-protein] synthase II